MKTTVFKKAGYFAASLALVVSGMTFALPGVAYAEGGEVVITKELIEEWGGSFPISNDVDDDEDACIGTETITAKLSDDIDLYEVGGSLYLDYPGYCSYEYGTTDIKNVILDLNGFSIGGNDDFSTIIIDTDTSLTVIDTSDSQRGNIFNSGNGPVFGVDGALTIEGGIYDALGNEIFTGDNAPVVKGGAYNKQIDTSYIASGYAEYVTSDPFFTYVVDVDTDIDDETTRGFFLRVGETVDIAANLDNVAKKYLTFTIERAFDYEDWSEYLAVDGTKLTGLKNGEMLAEMTLGKVGGYIYDVPVIVFDESEGAEVSVRLSNEKLTEEEFAIRFADEMEALKTSVGDGNIVGYYDVKAQLVDDTDWVLLDNLGETENYQVITATIPEDVPAVANGYERTWYFVYYHDGEVKYIIAVDNGDGTVSAKSKEFSPYILAYVDTPVAETSTTTTAAEVGSPDTGAFTGEGAGVVSDQSGLIATVAALGGLILAYGAVKFAKGRK